MPRQRWARLGLAAASVVAVLLAIDTAAWWWLTGRMVAEAAAWQAQRNAEGYAVQSGPATRGGWPLLATVAMADVTAATDPAGSVSWHADGVKLVLSPFAPHTVAVFLLGMQTVRLLGEPPVTLTAQQLDLQVPLSASGLHVEARGLSLPVARSEFAIGRLTAHAEGAAIDVVATGITLPGPSLPFGGALDRLELQAHSTLPLPAIRDLVAAATAWQRAGGQAVVDHAALRWGPLDGEAAGTLMLNPALQPGGTATLHLAGYAEALDALVRAGTMPRSQARVVTAVLGLMARPNASGAPEAELPLTLVDGVMKLGGMPLAKVPPLTWPGSTPASPSTAGGKGPG